MTESSYVACDYKRVFVYYLQQLKALLNTIEQHDTEEKDLLNSRLAADMFPLSTQVAITSNFSLRACCHLQGVDAVSYDVATPTYSGLNEQIALSINYIEQLPNDIPTIQTVSADKGGFSQLSLPAAEYLFQFAMPNFFFHMTTVYAIARQSGVPLSKGDFDGYHQYPTGFSFENRC